MIIYFFYNPFQVKGFLEINAFFHTFTQYYMNIKKQRKIFTDFSMMLFSMYICTFGLTLTHPACKVVFITWTKNCGLDN
jgi:hypothetical protein